MILNLLRLLSIHYVSYYTLYISYTKSLAMSIMQLELLIVMCNKYFVGRVYAFIYTFSCIHFTVAIALKIAECITHAQYTGKISVNV